MNTDSSQFITGREVAVLDMLNARDRRHAIQQELIRTHNATVISFTLNIPGPIKVFPLYQGNTLPLRRQLILWTSFRH